MGKNTNQIFFNIYFRNLVANKTPSVETPGENQKSTHKQNQAGNGFAPLSPRQMQGRYLLPVFIPGYANQLANKLPPLLNATG